jgi:hypothetical protein
MKEIAQRYLREIGIVNTQYSIVKHTDRAHLHLHIVANLVDYNGKGISDRWMIAKGIKASQHLTKEYGLMPVLEKNLKLTNLEALSEPVANKYKIYRAISESLPYCRTVEDLEMRLLKLGMQTRYRYNEQTKERQGISFKLENSCFKGSQIDPKYSLGNLEKILSLQGKEIAKSQPMPDVSTGPKEYISPQIHLPKDLHPHSTLNSGRDIGRDAAKVIEKGNELLLKHEQGARHLPFELLKRKKKKKQSRNLGL